MAARTFTSAGVNNLWSNAANWDGGIAIPAEDDSVTIPAGQTCEYDYNSAYTTGIAGITVTGTLKLTRAAGTYRLFLKAATTIGGTGTFDCGTSVSPIPFAAKHTVTGGNGWYVNGAGGLTMTVYAAEPVVKYVSLSANEALGQTVLSIDTDVTGETEYWKAGDIVFISPPSGGITRELAIVSVTSTELEVTPSLAGAYSATATIMMTSRNVRFITSVGTVTTVKNFTAGKLIIAGGEWRGETSKLFTNSPGIDIRGGSFYSVSSQNYYIDACNYFNISGGVWTSSGIGSSYGTVSGGYFQGYSNCINGTGNTFNGGTFLCGDNVAFMGSSNVVNDITVKGNNYCFSGSVVINGGNFYPKNYIGGFSGKITNAVFTREFWAGIFNAPSNVVFTNVKFNNAPPDIANTNLLPTEIYNESIDHDQVAGAYKAWTGGGITTKQAVTKPTGYDSAMQTVLASATKPGYWQKEVTVGAGASVNIEMNLRKNASMTYLPRIIVFNKASADPFGGGAGLHTFTMTDSIDTWESDVYTYTNTTAEDITLVIRCQGMNATGNMYSALDVEQINVDLTNAIAKIDVIDGLVDAIKAKTDQLAFTVANQVDANALTGGGGATAEDVADAVWDEAIADHTTGTTFGGKNQKVVPSETINDYKADVSGLATPTNITAGTITTVTNLTNLPTMPADWVTASGLKADALAVIVDSVWGSNIGDYTGLDEAGGEILTAIGNVAAIKAKTDNLPDDPADESSLEAAIAAVQAVIDNIHDTDLPAVKAETSGIKGKTDNLPTDPADQSALEAAIAGISATIDAADIQSAVGLATANLDTQLSAIKGVVDAISGFGLGSETWTYTVTNSGTSAPLPDVFVEVSSNIDGSTIVDRGITNSSGVVTFHLDPGTYYIWCHKTDYVFNNPDTETVP